MNHPVYIKCLACLTLIQFAVNSGCESKPDPNRKAHTAVAGLMPGPQPGYDDAYVSDPSQSKTAPLRKVTYAPFETFNKSGGGKTEKSESADDAEPSTKSTRKKSSSAKTAPVQPVTTPGAATPTGGPPGGGGFWQRVGMKSLAGAMGGAAPPPSGKQPEKPATDDADASEDSDDRSADKDSGGEDSGDDESDDDESSGDEDSGDADSDEEKSDDDGR